MKKNIDVYTLLRKRYPENAYALMEEVSNKSGFSRSRSADYLIMSLWPSRGLSLHGIELKASRTDWLRELKNPAKADDIFNFCDRFWLLTTDEAIANIEEIPETWGWMTIKGKRIFVKKEAPALKPKPITRHFLGAMLKRACSKDGFVRRSEIQNKIDEAKEYANRSVNRNMEYLQKSHNELKEQVRAFENETGVEITRLRFGTKSSDVGKAVKFLLEGGADSLIERLTRLDQTAKNIHDDINKGIESLKAYDNKSEE